MKKLTIVYSKKLQAVIDENKPLTRGLTWRDLPLMMHIHGLIAHVDQVAMSGKMSKPPVPIITPESSHYTLLGDHLPSTEEDLRTLRAAYDSSARIEVQVFTGMIDVCLGANFLFYPKGKGNVPMLVLEGAVDSDGIRYLRFQQKQR